MPRPRLLGRGWVSQGEGGPGPMPGQPRSRLLPRTTPTSSSHPSPTSPGTHTLTLTHPAPSLQSPKEASQPGMDAVTRRQFIRAAQPEAGAEAARRRPGGDRRAQGSSGSAQARRQHQPAKQRLRQLPLRRGPQARSDLAGTSRVAKWSAWAPAPGFFQPAALGRSQQSRAFPGSRAARATA